MVSMPQTAAITRLTLLPTAPPEHGAGAPRIRRYRLAAVRPAGTQDAAAPHAHLKRSYD